MPRVVGKTMLQYKGPLLLGTLKYISGGTTGQAHLNHRSIRDNRLYNQKNCVVFCYKWNSVFNGSCCCCWVYSSSTGNSVIRRHNHTSLLNMSNETNQFTFTSVSWGLPLCLVVCSVVGLESPCGRWGGGWGFKIDKNTKSWKDPKCSTSYIRSTKEDSL